MDVTADAAIVQAPALVLHRRESQVIPLEVSQALADLLPKGRLEILPGASASLFFERTDDITDRLTAFALDPSGSRLSPAGPRASPSHPRGVELSGREREVLRLIAAGESNGQIAATLGLSINTVERHVSNIYRKIDARGRADATAWAIRRGLA
jgi:DNA-binding CsgD family transcriptional regulator